MNALPAWDAEQPFQATSALPGPTTPALVYSQDAQGAASDESASVVPLPGGHRGAALAQAITTLAPSAGLAATVEHLLAAIDAADADAGIIRVDTLDASLHERIARIVSGASLPSRGIATRARDIIALLGTTRPV
jgi:hypothetical protein